MLTTCGFNSEWLPDTQYMEKKKKMEGTNQGFF